MGYISEIRHQELVDKYKTLQDERTRCISVIEQVNKEICSIEERMRKLYGTIKESAERLNED